MILETQRVESDKSRKKTRKNRNIVYIYLFERGTFQNELKRIIS